MAPRWERRQVLFGEYEPITGDPERDALACALRAIEAREGERRGWDRPARLWSLHLADIDSGAIELRTVPARVWRHGGRAPVEDILMTAVRLPAPPAEHDAPIRFADSPDGVAGIAHMYEGWTVPDEKLTDDERARWQAGEKVMAGHPERVEARMITAVDINGHGYHLRRIRGSEPEIKVGDDVQASGRVVQGLTRIAHALRSGAMRTT